MIGNPRYLYSSATARVESQGGHTVTSNYEEFVVIRDLMCNHVWKGGDYLLLGRKVGTLFELEVTNGS